MGGLCYYIYLRNSLNMFFADNIRYLFSCLKSLFACDSDCKPFTYTQLITRAHITIDDDIRFILYVLDFSKRQQVTNTPLADKYEEVIQYIFKTLKSKKYNMTIYEIGDSLSEHMLFNVLESLDMYWVLSNSDMKGGDRCKKIIKKIKREPLYNI